MESLYFLLPLFFIVLLFLPICFRFKAVLNLNKSFVLFSVFIFKFRIMLLRYEIKNKTLFVTYKKKRKEVQVKLSSKQIDFAEQFVENLKDKIVPKKVSCYSKIGTQNALDTAMLSGTITSLYKTFFCYLKNRKPTCACTHHLMPAFNQTIFLSCVYASLSISLFDLLYSFLISLFGIRRGYGEPKKSKLFR